MLPVGEKYSDRRKIFSTKIFHRIGSFLVELGGPPHLKFFVSKIAVPSSQTLQAARLRFG